MALFLSLMRCLHDYDTGAMYGVVLMRHENKEAMRYSVSSLSVSFILYVHDDETAQCMGRYYTDELPNLKMVRRCPP